MSALSLRFVFLATLAAATAADFQPMGILQRQGVQLINPDNFQPLKFASFNVPNLHYIEDAINYTRSASTEFEQWDALRSIAQLGGQITRQYTLSIAKPGDLTTWVHVAQIVNLTSAPPGNWTPIIAGGNIYVNEVMFRSIDSALAIARQVGVRVIFPFIDRWDWWGGIETFSGYYGLSGDFFYTDANIRNGFKALISFVLNRVNSVNGVRYADDGAIAMWETGNELTTIGGGAAPASWTSDIAAFIKSIDSNHLIMDGAYGRAGFQYATLQDPNIDVYTNHYYDTSLTFAQHAIIDSNYVALYNKAFIVGEFGLVNGQWYNDLLSTTVSNPNIAGALAWSLRFHSRSGGFYWHQEAPQFWSYHWPGFPYDASQPGFAFDETSTIGMVKAAAQVLSPVTTFMTEPPHPRPQLIANSTRASVIWLGSAGAIGYDVERAYYRMGVWRFVARGVVDNKKTGDVTWSDPGTGGGAYYRITAFNSYGRSEASDIVLLS